MKKRYEIVTLVLTLFIVVTGSIWYIYLRDTNNLEFLESEWSDSIELWNGSVDMSQQIVYDGKLYVTWTTNNDTLTNESDWDIVIQSYDGFLWSNITEITPSNDTYDSSFPQLAVYKGKLYVVWASGYTDQYGNVAGRDRDIFVRIFDCTEWSDVFEINPINDNADDVNPDLAVYNDKLYIAWQTNNPNLTHQWSVDDYDIVIRSFDGALWSNITEITDPTDDTWSAVPQLMVYNDRLFAIWDDYWTTIPGSGSADIHSEWDIAIRSFDGYQWSDLTELSNTSNSIESYYPQVAVYDDKLYVIWSEIGIKLKYLDGNKWSDTFEITSNNEKVKGTEPQLTVYNNKLYVLWQDKDYSIWITMYGGSHWSNIIMISKTSEEGKYIRNHSPQLTVYEGKLYAMWVANYYIPPKEPWGIGHGYSKLLIRAYEA